MLHDLEEQASHSAYKSALPGASSLGDLAQLFNSIAQGSASVPGGFLEPEELLSPEVIEKMLTGSLFQGTNYSDFLNKLYGIAPSHPYFVKHPIKKEPAPPGTSAKYYQPGMSIGELTMLLGRPEPQDEEDRRTMGHLYNPNPQYFETP